MKCLWKRIKKMWLSYWEDDELRCQEQHLSMADKRTLWQGVFLACFISVSLCCVVVKISTAHIIRQENEAIKELVGMVAAYMISATDDEYDEIARTLRYDLVFSEYGEDIGELLKYIPNMSENCPACMESYPAQVYLLCLNTGELYALDLYEKGRRPAENGGGIEVRFGYDEISQTSITITCTPDKGEGSVEIYGGRNIVSIHKMKACFCDTCIQELLGMIENQRMQRFVLFNGDTKDFYPVEDGSSVQIGSYLIKTEYRSDVFGIEIEYAGF